MATTILPFTLAAARRDRGVPQETATRLLALLDDLGLPSIALVGDTPTLGIRLEAIIDDARRAALIDAMVRHRHASARVPRSIGTTFLWEDQRVRVHELAGTRDEPVVLGVLQALPASGAWRLRLTGRQAEIAAAFAAGKRADEVGASLGITKHTARRHLEQVYSRLGVSNRAELSRVIRS
ncbi:MAG: LuxR C-terminal-related transcriptional regulator [Gemmatimonadaceae bacterium]|nr:LuxR C-terminal-related transcriptional regulator [Gemmatimonadaceae bacterium]